MNVAHKALQNIWIYLIFFSVVSQLKVIAYIVCTSRFISVIYSFSFSQLLHVLGHFMFNVIVTVLLNLSNYCNRAHIVRLFLTTIDNPNLVG